MLSNIEIVILGLIQGLIEWLPLSSEGINSLVMINFFGLNLQEAIYISLWLHLGTALAAIAYFWDDISGMIKNIPAYLKTLDEPFSDKNGLTSFLIISTFISGIFGLAIIKSAFAWKDLNGVFLSAGIGLLLVITGLIQRRASNMKFKNKAKKLGLMESITMGLVQGVTILPGFSRSGLTTSALLIKKFNAKNALRLSFLMSIPAVIVTEIWILFQDFNINAYYGLGILTSCLVGVLSLGTLMKIAEKFKFWKFCILIGILSFTPLMLSYLNVQ